MRDAYDQSRVVELRIRITVVVGYSARVRSAPQGKTGLHLAEFEKVKRGTVYVGAEALTRTSPARACFPDCRIKDPYRHGGYGKHKVSCIDQPFAAEHGGVPDDQLRIQGGDAQRRVGFGKLENGSPAHERKKRCPSMSPWMWAAFLGYYVSEICGENKRDDFVFNAGGFQAFYVLYG